MKTCGDRTLSCLLGLSGKNLIQFKWLAKEKLNSCYAITIIFQALNISNGLCPGVTWALTDSISTVHCLHWQRHQVKWADFVLLALSFIDNPGAKLLIAASVILIMF